MEETRAGPNEFIEKRFYLSSFLSTERTFSSME